VSNTKDATQGFFRIHLKILAKFGFAALIVSIAAGGLLLYLYRTGPDYAFKDLRAALNDGDKAKLATIVDFRALAEDLVQAGLAAYPQAAANEIQMTEMQDNVQRLALKALEAGKDTKPEIALPRKLFEPVPFVPEDVVVQFAAGMKLEKTSGAAQILSQFTHNGLQTNFPVRLLMERRRSGWLVTRLLNAQEVVSLYKSAMDAILVEDEAKLAETNKQIRSRMRAHFDSPQCLASVNLVGNRQEAMLIVKVTAKNTDSTTLHNVNLACDVHASNGTPVYSRHLNVVQRVYGGGAFSNIWTIILEADSEEAARLLQAGPLSCTVEPKAMSVGMGEVLYPRTD